MDAATDVLGDQLDASWEVGSDEKVKVMCLLQN